MTLCTPSRTLGLLCFLLGALGAAGCASGARSSARASAPPIDPAASPPRTAPVVEAARADACTPSCRLPCEEGISTWHARALGGLAFAEGTDPPKDCGYLGADLGRTFCGSACGCWGVDLFYRTHQGRFDRAPGGGKDGGRFHHLGVKATWERSLGRSRLYGYAGAGPEFFWTDDYRDDDSGFGAFAEAGVGYRLTRNLRVRAGLNVHGLDTDVARRSAADDGDGRWLWIVAPSVGIEFDR